MKSTISTSRLLIPDHKGLEEVIRQERFFEVRIETDAHLDCENEILCTLSPIDDTGFKLSYVGFVLTKAEAEFLGESLTTMAKFLKDER